MARQVKSVSLDPRTSAIAARMGNFSAFVRECLIRYEIANLELDDGCRRDVDGDWPANRLCPPFQKRYPGRCPRCWPAGRPTPEDWARYINAELYETQGWRDENGHLRWDNPRFADHTWILEATAEINPPIFPVEDIDPDQPKPSGQSGSRRSRLSIISRVRKFLRF